MVTTPRILFIVGLPASGKSEARQVIVDGLVADGYKVITRTDKEELERQVLLDVNRFRGDPTRALPNGGIRGEHSIVLNPDGEPGTLQIKFIDGHALNSAHIQLLRDARRFVDNAAVGQVLVVEWAYGGDVEYPGEPLRQTGTQLVAWLGEYDLLDNSMGVEIKTGSFEERLARNRRRLGHIPDDEFSLYFPEVGHFTPEDMMILGNRWGTITSEGTDESSLQVFRDSVGGLYRSFLLPWLEGRPGGIETAGPSFKGKEF